MERVQVGSVANMPEGHQCAVEVSGVSVLITCYEGKFYALRNNCTHQDFPLLGGSISMGRISCEKHGGKFDLETGKAKALPAVKAVKLYKTEVEDDMVYVSEI